MPLAEVQPRDVVAPGTYEGVVVSVEKDIIVPRQGKNAGQDVPVLRWNFDIGAEETVESITGRDPSSEKSNLFKYFVALLGSDRDAWLRAEMSDLVGRKALVTVGVNDDGWNRVDGVTAMPVRRSAPQPAASVEPESPPTRLDDESGADGPGDLPF